MSPKAPDRANKPAAFSDVYTILLGLAFLAVAATAAFLAFKCYSQYGKIF